MNLLGSLSLIGVLLTTPASRVMAMAIGGNIVGANNLLDGEYTEKSDKLARALTKWKGELVATDRAA